MDDEWDDDFSPEGLSASNSGSGSMSHSSSASSAFTSTKHAKVKKPRKEKYSMREASSNFQDDDHDYDDDDDGVYQVLGKLSNSMGSTGIYTSPFTTAMQRPLSIGIPQQSMSESFPEPSPAACGKRKVAELAAAKILASSSNQDIEGAQVLSMMKEAAYRPGEIVRRRKVGSSLSIINPDTIPAFSLTPGQEPDTPWENEVRALETNNFSEELYAPVFTPSEQRDFTAKLIATIRRASLQELKSFLKSMEESALTSVAANLSAGGDMSLMPMSPPNGLPRQISFEAKFDSKSDNSSSNVEAKAPDAFSTSDSSFSNVSANDGFSSSIKSSGVLGRSLNKAGKDGCTPLREACLLTPAETSQETIVDMCRVLIEHGASTGAKDSQTGGTCLHIAAKQGYAKVGRLLINKGCSVNEVDEAGEAAIHIAARQGHGLFLELLADFGANCHIRNVNGQAALDLAGSKAAESSYSCTSSSSSSLSSSSITLEEQSAHREELRRIMLSVEPRLRTLILYHEDCLLHMPRRRSDWEGPDRLKMIMRYIQEINEFADHELEISTHFEKAPVELLSRVHSPEYITFVDNLSKQMQKTNDGDEKVMPLPFTPQVQRIIQRYNSEDMKDPEYCDTTFSVGTLKAARRAAGAVAHAVDRILLGRNRNAFCVVRPPGHHAGYNGLLDGGKSCGFCIFNSVAAGALHALEAHNCERVAIIDLDIHHGNGTEDIVRRYAHPSRLFFFSLHLFERSPEYEFFPGTGALDDTAHNIVNVPLLPLWLQCSPCAPANSALEPVYGREAYKKAIIKRLIPALRAFNPSLILLSSGFDPASGDLGNTRTGATGVQKGMDMRPVDFEWVTSEIMKIADICCNGRVVSVLEGGYGSYAKPTRATRASSKGGDVVGVDYGAESDLNRTTLAISAVAHIHRLVDPYG